MQVFEQVNQIAIRAWKSLPTGVDSVAELQRDNELLNQVREECSRQPLQDLQLLSMILGKHTNRPSLPEQLAREIQNKQNDEDVDIPVAGNAPASEN